MAHYQIIDTATQPRRDHFTFYRQFVSPSSNLCAPIVAQRLYECAKGRRALFFQPVLYALLHAANGVSRLQQRVCSDEVIEYDSLAVMTSITTIEERFRQVWCDNAPELAIFSDVVAPKTVATRKTTPTPFIVDNEHFTCTSCLPWLRFVSMTHVEYAVGMAVPALTWRRLQNGMISMVRRLNHTLVNGLHTSRFSAFVEEGFSDPERLWQSLTETTPSLLAPVAKKR